MADSAASTVVAPAAPAPHDELVQVRAEDLIVGRKLDHPIHGDGGVLLLSAGSVITPRFFELLRSRKIGNVRLHPSDASRVTLQGAAPAVSPPVAMRFDTALTQKLDALIEAGSLFVANTGPSIRDNMTMHGCRAYDPVQRESLIDQHKATGESLDNMMREAMHGKRVDLKQITSISATYLTQLTSDCDNVLTVAREAGRDEELAAHCLQMSLMGMAIGVEMGLDERNVRTIGLCGLVHDWGMVRVPTPIRSAERLLTSREFLEIQRHPIHSLELLQQVAGIPSVVPLVAYQVHECPSGDGYPRGRRGSSIHIFARILKVADAYSALTARRSYRPKLMPYAAMELLVRQSHKKLFDARVVRSLLHVVSLFPIGSLATLSDGSVVRILRSNREAYTRPIVQMIQNKSGEAVDPTSPDAIIDLRESKHQITQALPEPGSGEIGITPEIVHPGRN